MALLFENFLGGIDSEHLLTFQFVLLSSQQFLDSGIKNILGFFNGLQFLFCNLSEAVKEFTSGQYNVVGSLR